MSPVDNTPVPIRGAMRDYDWGMTNGLSEWTGVSTDGPQAELWFGAHPAAPSVLLASQGDQKENLLDRLASSEVPLLTKILAAASPLSLQVHPTARQAQEWRRSEAGRALLPDDVGKAEMLIALEEFIVLVGWRAAAEASAILAAAGASEAVLSAVAAGDPEQAIRLLLSSDRIEGSQESWNTVVTGCQLDEVTSSAMARVAAKFPGDPGIAVAVLLQSRVLDKGDAVYLPVGVPHAYVHGRGVEIMTNSDNVLRMGLTSKTVSVDHAVAALDLSAAEQVIRDPADGGYLPTRAPFQARMAEADRLVAEMGAYRLVLVLSGGAQVRVGNEHWSLTVGQALVVPAHADDLAVHFLGSGVLVSQALGASEESQ